MKPLKLALLIVGVLLAGLFVGRLTSSDPAADAPAIAETGAATEFTCSMHPQIRQPNPGKCPICAMDLIPAGRAETGDGGAREISLTEHAKSLARIVTSPVEKRVPEAEIRLFGRVMQDESRMRSIAARFPARIEQLYVNYTGVQVNAGDHLAKIYSPELLTAQTELLSALRFNDARAIRSAREKLALWSLSEKAIAAIESKGEPSDTMDIDAPLGGIVMEKMVNDGDYVETGAILFRIADLSTVWVVLDAYERDLPWLRFGQPVQFTVEALPGQTFEGRISFIPPVLDPETRTFKIRVNASNLDLRLRPGMFATGLVQARVAGEGILLDPSLEGKWISPMHPEIVKDAPGSCDVCGMDLVSAEQLGYVADAEIEPPLLVPKTAVLQTGRRAIVYVEIPDRDQPTYEGREVVLGPRAGDYHIVKSGLKVDERVVTNGAFKLDSALQLLAKPSMMSPVEEGGEESIEEKVQPVIEIKAELWSGVLEAYLNLQEALADDNLEGSKMALKEMMETTGHSGPLPDLLHKMLAADSLDGIRRPHFETLSNAVIDTAKKQPKQQSLFLMHCPMVYDDRGASWLQRTESLRNPYFGDAMLTCGEMLELH